MGENKDIRQKDDYLNIGPKQLAIFKDTNFTYLYSKSEKVVTALYMITNFLSTNEPLKWQIRDNSLKFLDAVMSLSKTSLSSREIVMREISGHLFQVKSLFNIAYKSGFISTMNFEIVAREIEHIIGFLIEMDTNKLSIESELFNKTFFGENLSKGQVEKEAENIKDRMLKGQKNNRPIISKTSTIKDNVTGTMTDRRQKIITILKGKKDISVKDISAQISDCSEKTLQRELLAMVAEGLILKEGERRWSKYSLNSALKT